MDSPIRSGAWIDKDRVIVWAERAIAITEAERQRCIDTAAGAIADRLNWLPDILHRLLKIRLPLLTAADVIERFDAGHLEENLAAMMAIAQTQYSGQGRIMESLLRLARESDGSRVYVSVGDLDLLKSLLDIPLDERSENN